MPSWKFQPVSMSRFFSTIKSCSFYFSFAIKKKTKEWCWYEKKSIQLYRGRICNLFWCLDDRTGTGGRAAYTKIKAASKIKMSVLTLCVLLYTIQVTEKRVLPKGAMTVTFNFVSINQLTCISCYLLYQLKQTTRSTSSGAACLMQNFMQSNTTKINQ